jgi:hypothetical protein
MLTRQCTKAGENNGDSASNFQNRAVWGKMLTCLTTCLPVSGFLLICVYFYNLITSASLHINPKEQKKVIMNSDILLVPLWMNPS